MRGFGREKIKNNGLYLHATFTSHKTLYVIMKEETQKEKLVKKFNIQKESLTEENILKDFQEDIKNLPNEFRS